MLFLKPGVRITGMRPEILLTAVAAERVSEKAGHDFTITVAGTTVSASHFSLSGVLQPSCGRRRFSGQAKRGAKIAPAAAEVMLLRTFGIDAWEQQPRDCNRRHVKATQL